MISKSQNVPKDPKGPENINCNLTRYGPQHGTNHTSYGEGMQIGKKPAYIIKNWCLLISQ